MRILLVIEDINQSNTLRIILTKLGCVIESQSVELGLKDKILSIRPEIIVTAGTGKKVNPINVTQKSKESKLDIKVILLLGKGMKLSLNDLAENRYDAFVESPVDPLKLISSINKFRSSNSIDLVEKYQKIMLGGGFASNLDARHVKTQPIFSGGDSNTTFGAKFTTTLAPEARQERYKDLTFGINVAPESTIKKSEVRTRLIEMQKDWDMKRLEEIDVEKRRFVNELFRKK